MKDRKNTTKPILILLRGGGDVASGVGLRLRRAGLHVVITELPQPMVVRRRVSFAEAVYAGTARVEELLGRRVTTPAEVEAVLAAGELPVLVDPQAGGLEALQPDVLIDGRMLKRPPELGMQAAGLVIGLGPGFTAGQDCHVVIETNRGHNLGRAIWQGPAEADTGIPEHVASYGGERVLRAPADGLFAPRLDIGQHVETGEVIAEVAGQPVLASFSGVLRGLLYPGLPVTRGLKVGDIDPRDDPSYCYQVSDKALAVGGGALEAILSRRELRPRLWER